MPRECPRQRLTQPMLPPVPATQITLPLLTGLAVSSFTPTTLTNQTSLWPLHIHETEGPFIASQTIKLDEKMVQMHKDGSFPRYS